MRLATPITGVTGPNVTKIVHNVEKFILFTILKSELWYCNLFQNGSATKEIGQFFDFKWLNGNVPWQMAKQSTVSSSACKALSYGEKIVKIIPVYPDIFHEIHRSTTSTRNAISISQFSAETSGPIFTKNLHNIVALVALFHLAHTRRYPIPFMNDIAISAGGVGNFVPFFHKIGCHGNGPWDIEKRGPDRSSTPKQLSFDVKIAKIGPADPEIICLQEIIKKIKKERNYRG